MTDFITQRRNVEKLLKKRAFCGHYVERRLIDERRGYRDIVWLSPEETELAADLAFASVGCRSVSPDMFTSYTTHPVPSMMVTLQDIPLGCHWFQITSALIKENELVFQIKSLRSFPGIKFPSPKKTSIDDLQISSNEVIESIQHNFKTFIHNVSPNNVIHIIKFILILFTTIVTGMFQLIYFLGDFCIKLMHELSFFTKVSTPIMLGFFEFVSKIIGGFYILLAMLWRGSVQPQAPYSQQSFPAIDYRNAKSPSKDRKIFYSNQNSWK